MRANTRVHITFDIFRLVVWACCILVNFENESSNLKWCIYCIYGVLSGSIRQYSRLNLGFFRPRSRNALGPSALGHFLTSDEKCLGFGAILSYRSLQHPIYTLHILYYIYTYMQNKYLMGFKIRVGSWLHKFQIHYM